jgi:predicted ATPase
MQTDAQPDTLDIELDPALLATPFRVQTRWCVITGAPSCGKTTLIDQLAAMGFRTVAEVARQYIERQVAQGRTVAEIRREGASLQRRLMRLQQRREEALPAREVVFLDRGLPDCLAFLRLHGADPNDLLHACFHYRYAQVFLLAPLAFRRDGTRLESDAEIAAYLDQWHDRDYRALGYEVVRVPVVPPEERLAFVLERAGEPRPRGGRARVQ